MDSELEPFVNDCRINLFEIAWLTDEQVAGFKSDFRIVADYFVQMRKTGTYHGYVEDVKHMGEVLQLMSMLTNDVRFQETMYGGVKEGDGPKNMCKVLDRIEKQGIEKGIEPYTYALHLPQTHVLSQCLLSLVSLKLRNIYSNKSKMASKPVFMRKSF